ncbi:aspartyl protease [Ceratobasidium sp. AG-Ba]|nr:aspartyl protease [Ceratobasidium sp. AG-Ba]
MIASLAFTALLAASSVLSHPGSPINIPVNKRSSSLTSNGIVNMSALQKEMARARDKYTMKHFGGLVKKWQVYNEPLNDEGDQLWDGLIKIGDPCQSFRADFDTHAPLPPFRRHVN